MTGHRGTKVGGFVSSFQVNGTRPTSSTTQTQTFSSRLSLGQSGLRPGSVSPEGAGKGSEGSPRRLSRTGQTHGRLGAEGGGRDRVSSRGDGPDVVGVGGAPGEGLRSVLGTVGGTDETRTGGGGRRGPRATGVRTSFKVDQVRGLRERVYCLRFSGLRR